MDVPFQIRSAQRADAPAMARLERRCFTDPWSEPSFREVLAMPWGFALVGESEGHVVAYIIGREAAGTGEVLNLAVAPELRRQGIGRMLLRAGLAAFAARGAEEVFLEVRQSNAAAQQLYQELGFQAVGLRRGYYRNPRESALVLRLGLTADAGAPPADAGAAE